MLTAPGLLDEPIRHRNHVRAKDHWHDGRHTPSFGCAVCPDLTTCGDLRIPSALYDCLDLCCHQPERCDSVCRNKPIEFAKRVREIRGFPLDNVPRAQQLSPLPLPSVVPVLYHGKSRKKAFAPPSVCLSLYSAIPRQDGRERYADAVEVANAFRFRLGTPIILTGTDKDAPLERWWSTGPGRIEAIDRLRDLGVELVTTPNYSLFTDRPRWDDMHSMKRIAITHEEFLRMGIPAALHLNARTERDWERWTEYIFRRREVTHIAFEFATGSGATERIEWHVDQLTKLASSVNRPLHLVVRAARRNILAGLVSAFAHTTVLDTTAFIKTVHRQRAVEANLGRICWEPSPTSPGTPLDDLLQHNWRVIRRSYDSTFVISPRMSAVG